MYKTSMCLQPQKPGKNLNRPNENIKYIYNMKLQGSLYRLTLYIKGEITYTEEIHK